MTEVTATLKDWSIHTFSGGDGKFLHGRIYNDTKHRWENGHVIRTSLVLSMSEDEPKEGVIVTTANSTYLLGNPFSVAGE